MNFRQLDPQALGRTDAYKLFVTCIVPRPIGWISTLSTTGVSNAAPFSFFNAVCSDPLMVMIAVGKRRGELKDTLLNIRDTGEFVTNIATADTAAQMVQSSADYGREVSEFSAVGLTPLPSVQVKPPRIAESPIQIECRLEQIIPLGNNSTDLIIGRCVLLHINETVLAEDGLVDAARLRPMARLGREEYSVVEQVLHYPRPHL
ncbi:MAG: hypothetical protein HJJLKODD_00923 [Phycisphaerae bacterium]|nr:hypothetical protein [Phycisphaerae bacterium]